MDNIKNNIIKKIEKGEISKESRLRFLAHDYFFWTLGVVSILFGSISVATILHGISIEQLRPLGPFMRDPDTFIVFIQTLPYVWLALFALLLIAGWFNYRKTSFSYRRHNGAVIMGVVLVSLILGMGFFALGAGKEVDERSRAHVPLLKKEFERRERIRNDFLERRGKRMELMQEQRGETDKRQPTR